MRSLRKLLVATDFQESGMRAVDVALDWASRLGAELHVVHVVEHVSSAATPSGEPLVVRYSEQMRRQAKEKLREIEIRAEDRDLEAHFHIQEGHAGAAIVAITEKIGVDCVLVGSHGRTGLAHFWFGSVAERVVREAPCSVLVVRGDLSPSDPKKIVLGDDLTLLSSQARRLAVELAGEAAAELMVVHSLELGIPYLSTIEVVVPTRAFDDAFQHAKTRLDELAQETPGVAVESVVVGDGPAHELCQRAESESAGLVVVGSDSRGRIDRVFLGAVAERVVRHSPCSVLVVRSAGPTQS